MELNTIHNIDCINGFKTFVPDNSIDLIFADPPYWLRVDGVLNRVDGTEFRGCGDKWDNFESIDDYKNFTFSWLGECRRVLKPNGSIWIIGGMQCIYTIGAAMLDLGFWIINDVVWHKKNPTPNFMGTRLNNSHETMIWAVKDKKSKYTFHYKTAKELNRDNVSKSDYENGVRKQMGSVWRYPICGGNERMKDESGRKLHSTQKPLNMLERIIAISSNIGDVVLDPFGGTMTTAAAAKKLGRNYIMFETDKKYCECGEDRLSTVKFEDNPAARALYDEKPAKVTMPEMISAGFFTVGEKFYLKDKSVSAVLTDEGKLNFGGEVLDMHTCAARAKKLEAKRLNGFDSWYADRDGKLVRISEIRENYRKSLKK